MEYARQTGHVWGSYRMFVELKPLAERQISADQALIRLRGKLLSGVLEPLEVHQEAPDRVRHCGRPSPGTTGVMPRSARSVAARRLPVCSHRS